VVAILDQTFRDDWGAVVAAMIGFLGDFDLAEEAAQDAFAVAAERWPRDGYPSNRRAWLVTTARNRAIDSLRRGQTQPQLRTISPTIDGRESVDDDVYDTVADESPGPLDLLSRAADARALAACMDQLSASQRQSVALAFFQGLSHAEVAEQLRQPLGTVKSWVRRSLMTLKSCLETAGQREARAQGD